MPSRDAGSHLLSKDVGMSGVGAAKAAEIAARGAAFVRDVVVPYEKDPRRDGHGPTDELVAELREQARAAGGLTPHILPAGSQLRQRPTATVPNATRLSPSGPGG